MLVGVVVVVAVQVVVVVVVWMARGVSHRGPSIGVVQGEGCRTQF